MPDTLGRGWHSGVAALAAFAIGGQLIEVARDGEGLVDYLTP